MSDHFVITVARGFGSGGKEIASKLAHDLGIHCYENRILTLASQMSGLDEQLFTEVNERLRKDKYSGLLRGLPRSLKPKAEETFVSDDHLFAIQKQIIEQLADTESCVIGRQMCRLGIERSRSCNQRLHRSNRVPSACPAS